MQKVRIVKTDETESELVGKEAKGTFNESTGRWKVYFDELAGTSVPLPLIFERDQVEAIEETQAERESLSANPSL